MQDYYRFFSPEGATQISKHSKGLIKIPHPIETYHNDMDCAIGTCRIREVFSERFSPIMAINKIPPRYEKTTVYFRDY